MPKMTTDRDTASPAPTDRGTLQHYARWAPDILCDQLVDMDLDPAFFTAETLEGDGPLSNLLGAAAGTIARVLEARQRLPLIDGQLEFVLVDTEKTAARIAPVRGGYLIAITKRLVLRVLVSFLQLTHTQAFADLFDLPVAVHDFAVGGDEAARWDSRLLATITPDPTVEQYAAAVELGQLALATLVNHEIGHAAHQHFDAAGIRSMFSEGREPLAPDQAQAYESQCLEIDADGFGIGATLLDCLAGYYQTYGPNAELTAEGWRGSLVAYDAVSATRSVAFANLMLWTLLDNGRDHDAWGGDHPPPFYRALASATVLRSNLVQLKSIAHLGAPAVDLEACDAAYHQTAQAYLQLMDTLGNAQGGKIGRLRQAHFDAHTERLHAVWRTLRERLPKYRRQDPGQSSDD